MITPREAWRRYVRWLDIKLLWPSIRKEGARRGLDTETMREAFRLHIGLDPAWRSLSEEKIERVLARLK